MSVVQMMAFAALVGIVGGAAAWFAWDVLENLFYILGSKMSANKVEKETTRRKTREAIEEEVREGRRGQKA